MNVLINLTVVIISHVCTYVYQIITSYTLNFTMLYVNFIPIVLEEIFIQLEQNKTEQIHCIFISVDS